MKQSLQANPTRQRKMTNYGELTMKIDTYEGILLNLQFKQGAGDVNEMPTHGGIYAEIHWPTKSLRIGETGNSLRARNRGHLKWAEKHRLGTHTKPEEIRRAENGNSPITEHAKIWGAAGTEYYVITDDQNIRQDRKLRVACERYLHEWARQQNTYTNLNTQRGYRTQN